MLRVSSLWLLAAAAAMSLAVACDDQKITGGSSGSSSGGDEDAGLTDGEAPFDDAGSDAAPPAAGAVRIATYNVQNFFDTVCDTGLCKPSDYETQFTPAQYESKSNSVASGVRKIGADVVLLQEIEKDACLQTLSTKLNNAYPYKQIGETNFNGSVDVAILSKDPIKAVRTHRQDKFKLTDNRTVSFTREFLEVDLDRKGTLYTVFVGHFKAKVDDDPVLRLGEATEARKIVLATAAANPGRLVVFGGDLNDFPGSPPLNALVAGGEMVLAELRDLSGNATFTEFSGGTGHPIDHLLVPKALTERHVKGTTRVVQDAANKGLSGSDHAGLLADFLVSPP